jgi:hypothetical protein
MKQFLAQHRNSIPVKALYSSATIALFIYIVIRSFAFDFPMTWFEEIALFVKICFTSTFMMSLATIGCAGLYRAYERLKRQKKTA